MMSLQLYSEFAVDSMMQQRENEFFLKYKSLPEYDMQRPTTIEVKKDL